MGVHKKLMEARIKLQSIKMKKSGKNNYAGYDYFELSDFIPHVQRIFNDIGLCGFITYNRDFAILTITDLEDGSEIVITSPMAEANLKGCHPVQNLGAVETYQRRYLWITAMEILEHDAIDSSAGAENNKPASKKELIPSDSATWARAKAAFLRDGNLQKVLASMSMSKENQELLMEECERERAMA